MKYNWVDLILGVLTVLAFVAGYRTGFIKSIFSMIGFVGGGVLGLALGWNFLQSWENILAKFALLLLAISIGSTIGQWALIKFAKFFHSKILFGPFKWADSLLGAAFYLIRTLLMAYLIATICIATPWSWADENIPTSKIYQEIDSYTPQIIKTVTDRVDSLTK